MCINKTEDIKTAPDLVLLLTSLPATRAHDEAPSITATVRLSTADWPAAPLRGAPIGCRGCQSIPARLPR